MAHITKAVLFFAAIFLMIGCQVTQMEQPKKSPSYTKLSTKQVVSQHLSNDVKDYLKKNNQLTSVQAVNDHKQLLVTFEIPHMKRFNLKEIRNKVKKDIHQTFDIKTIEVSTDQKIILELKKLEKKIQENTISQNEIHKELTRIIHLSNEQT